MRNMWTGHLDDGREPIGHRYGYTCATCHHGHPDLHEATVINCCIGQDPVKKERDDVCSEWQKDSMEQSKQ